MAAVTPVMASELTAATNPAKLLLGLTGTATEVPLIKIFVVAG